MMRTEPTKILLWATASLLALVILAIPLGSAFSALLCHPTRYVSGVAVQSCKDNYDMAPATGRGG
jgi:hypothetical protein